MTNKDKFLKDGVDVEELTSKLIEYAYKEKEGNLFKITKGFFAQEAKLTLTEDERVILRNIDTNYYPTIKKMCRTLYIVSKEDTYKEIEDMFKDHLFQFIKEGEEYSIQELLGDDQ